MPRLSLLFWTLAAVGGSVAVWWLSSYLETLTALAQTDRAAALALFRTRAMPALLVVVGVAVAAGAMLLRQGLQIARAEPEGRTARPHHGRGRVPPGGGAAGAHLGGVLAARPGLNHLREVAAPRPHLAGFPAQLHFRRMPSRVGHPGWRVADHVALAELAEDFEERPLERRLVAREDDAPAGLIGERIEQPLGWLGALGAVAPFP